MPAWVPDAPRPARRPALLPAGLSLPAPLLPDLRRVGRRRPGSDRGEPAHVGPDPDARLRRAVAEAQARADPHAPPPLRETVGRALADLATEDGDTPPSGCPRPAGLRDPDAVLEELVGFGPLAPWVRRTGVTDVLVDAAGSVWTDGVEGLVRRPLILPEPTARVLAVRLIGLAGRRLDPACPVADARVDGVRVHAVLPPVSGGGTVLSLRVPAAEPPSLDALAADWPDGERWRDAVVALVRGRASVLVSGATGTGKTTLLAAALGLAGADERIVLVEDTAEAAPAHPHVISLQARAPTADGAGEVTLAELIRQALRMRPDRLVVGECRGPEVADLLTALNTGHQGAWGTLHANAAADVPARLAAMGALAGWSASAVAAQARAGVDAVLHVRRDGRGRHPVELAVPAPAAHPDAPLSVLPALTWDGGGTRAGPGLEVLEARLSGRGHG